MNGYSTYFQAQSTGETVRESEAQALLRCALKMEDAQRDEVGYFDYCYAVRQNQKLWTIFQASLLDPETKLPAELIDTLKSLSIYVDRRSLRCIGEFDKTLLRVLIDINKQIATGLMQRTEGEAASPQPMQQAQSHYQPQPQIQLQQPAMAGSGSLNISG